MFVTSLDIERLFDYAVGCPKRHYPDRKDKVLNQIKNMRGGQLNDPRFSTRMSGEGIFAEHLSKLFTITCRRLGLNKRRPAMERNNFRRPLGDQLRLL